MWSMERERDGWREEGMDGMDDRLDALRDGRMDGWKEEGMDGGRKGWNGWVEGWMGGRKRVNR